MSGAALALIIGALIVAAFGVAIATVTGRSVPWASLAVGLALVACIEAGLRWSE